MQAWLDAPYLGWTFYQAYWARATHGSACSRARVLGDPRLHEENGSSRPPSWWPRRAPSKAARSRFLSPDATNSGAPGDSTHLLAALLAEPIGEGGALAFCVDPESVARCAQAGLGATVVLDVGGKRDPYSEPLAVSAGWSGSARWPTG